MRTVIQRVQHASVTIDGKIKSKIGNGFLLLLGVEESDALGREVGTGEFGADMKVELLNDGPVTICMDTKNKE